MTLPVLDPDLPDGIAEAVRRIPGVDDVAAVLRRTVRTAATPIREAGRPATSPAGQPGRPAAPVTRPGAATPMAALDGGDFTVPHGVPATLQQALSAAARLAPGKGTVYLTQDHDDVLQTYPELLHEAQRVLGGLRAAGLHPGNAVLFQFAGNRAYLTAFWACVLGGFLPTPVAVPATYRTANETNRKLHNAWKLLDEPVLLTEAATAGDLAGVRELWDEPGVRIHTVEDLLRHDSDPDWYPASPGDPVLNLLTSGSTGVPKCVQHTHASVTARSLAAARHSGLSEDDVSLIWMPYDHVTVAFYNVRDVFLRCLHVTAKIEHFLADPLLWLEWADRYRATNTWAPNFAFSMVTGSAEQIRARSWDLSSLREIVNAGEPVIAATCRRFLELLAPHGLPGDAIRPVWGMSETCSGVTYSRLDRDNPAAGTVTVDAGTLGAEIREAVPGAPGAVTLSAVGRPIPGVRFQVVDDTGTVVPELTIGELHIRGRTMMSGYFANLEANRQAYDADGWFRTGDLAFVRGGELVIAGRKKDQIIVRGVNYLAHELESVVERVEGIRVTFVAAAGVRDPGAESDQLVIFFVPEHADADAVSRTAEAVRATLGREAGLAPDLLVPLGEAEFPKTASGKIQRAALVAELRAGHFTDRAIGPGAGSPQPVGADTSRSGDNMALRRVWVEIPAVEPTGAKPGVRLVLAEDDELRCLNVDGPVVVARRGPAFAAQTAARFEVAAHDRAEIHKLLEAVTAHHGPITSIVSGLSLSGPGDPMARLTTASAEFGALTGALADGSFGDPLVLVLTAGAAYARSGDVVDLGTCALPALVRTALSEVPGLTLRQVDLPADHDRWGPAVRAELADRHRIGLVAVREGLRWQPRLSPADEPLPATPPARAGGCYLLTGGLGGIAGEIAGYLLAGYGLRLLLAGRSPAEGERAETLTALSRLGDVHYVELDVADPQALRAAVTAAERRWGSLLDGVLHLAGADPTAQWANSDAHTIAEETMATYAGQYRAKVAGTLAIAELLAERPAAELVLFGSVNGEFGGHSFGAYSAANAFLSGFADYWHHVRGRTVHCLAWSMWTGVGMNRKQSTAAARNRGFRAIEPDDGLRLFLAAWGSTEHYLVLGLDLSNPAIVEELAPDRLGASELLVCYTGTAAPETVRQVVDEMARNCPVPVRLSTVARIPRTARGTVDATQLRLEAGPRRSTRAFAPPVGDLERVLAHIWSTALDRPRIGRDDSFFELGGNSLRATRLLALVRDRLAVRVPTQDLYENPTVAGLAAIIARPGTGRAG